MKFQVYRPSPALVISVIALIVALGGTAYAGFTIPRNSVGTKQLKNGAVTTKQLKNSAVTTKKIKNSAVTARKINTSGLTVPDALHANSATSAGSATDAANATNASTARNTTGVAGPLAAGQTESGVFGLQGDTGPDGASPFESVDFQIPLPAAPVMSVVPSGGPTTAHCSGSFTTPTAAPGYLCLYEQVVVGASGVSFVYGPAKFGVLLQAADVGTDSYFDVAGTWAVTAN